jgi:hypothetical protein
MQNQAKNLKAALKKTVNTDGLKTKIVEKFMGFLRVNVNKKENGENPEIAGSGEVGPPA